MQVPFRSRIKYAASYEVHDLVEPGNMQQSYALQTSSLPAPPLLTLPNSCPIAPGVSGVHGEIAHAGINLHMIDRPQYP